MIKFNQFSFEKKENVLSLWLMLVGIAIPFILVTSTDYFHKGDVGIFHQWANCWDQNIYLECQIKSKPNYPVVGLSLSAGAIYSIRAIFHISNQDSSSVVFFRYYLALFDALNFILLTWLASLLKFYFPVIIGLILLLVPSTWVGGGSVWGQIDGISLFFCLLCIICVFKSWLVSDAKQESRRVWKSGLWLIVGSLNFTFYLLTKQLAIFSLPFFAFLILISVSKMWNSYRYKGLLWVFSSLLFFLYFFHFLDSSLKVPEQFYNSSYIYIWTGGGSDHGGVLSGNGFNIWRFLGRSMHSSSQIPFFTLRLGSWKHEFTPYRTGIFLYAIFLSFIILTGFRKIQQVVKEKLDTSQDDKANIYLMALLCLFHGLSHLSFNVFLSGTHERYLYLGYPFLLIAVAWFYSKKIVFSWRSTLLCFLSASAYGGFVYSIMGAPFPKIFFFLRRPEFLALIHLFLLLYLLECWIQITQFKRKSQTVDSMMRAIFRTR